MLPIQKDDIATRLRRAFGLRGRLSYDMSDLPVVATAQLEVLDQPPFADTPSYWSASVPLHITTGSVKVTPLFVVNDVGSGIVIGVDGFGKTLGWCTIFAQLFANASPADPEATDGATLLNRIPTIPAPAGTPSEPRVGIYSGTAVTWPFVPSQPIARSVAGLNNVEVDADLGAILWQHDFLALWIQPGSADIDTVVNVWGRVWQVPEP